MLAIASNAFYKAINIVRSPISAWWNRDQKQLLEKVIFAANGHIPTIGRPILSWQSVGSAFTVTDYTFAYRSVIDLLNSLHVTGWFQQTFGTIGATMVYQGSGISSGLGLFVGAAQIKQASKAIEYSHAISDKRGTLIGRVSILKELSYMGGALGFTGFRVMGIFDSIKNIAATPGSASLVGRVSYGVLTFGLVFFALFFVFLGVISGIKIFEGAKLKKKLKGKELAEQLEIIQRQITANPERIKKKLIEKLGDKAATEKLMKLALSSGKEQLRGLLKELNIPQISDEKLGEIVEKVVQNREQLVDIGLKLMTEATQAKKQAKLGRILNKEALEALKSSTGAELVDKVQNGVNKKLIENSILTAIFVFAVIALVAAMVFSGGTGLIVAAVLMLTLTILAVGVDGYMLLQSYKEETTGIHDKKMLVISSVVALLTFVAIAALVGSGVVTIGIVPLVAGIVLTLIWLGQNGVTWAILNRNERLHDEKNPTLEILLKALSKEKDGDRLERMLNNLPADIQNQINQTSDRLKKIEITKELIRKVEEAKVRRMEEMRKALAPLMIQ